MKLFCVRHGETLYNVEGRIQGQSDSHLSALGRRQCQWVAAALAPLEIEAVISSPLARALESARCVADRLGLAVEREPRLMEINAGVFQGHTWAEIDERYPEAWARWRSQDPDFRIPGGESRRDVMLRARGAFDAIRAAGHRQVIVMAHGGSLSAALKELLGIPAGRNPFTFHNGSITRAVWESDFKLVSLNETGHLCDASGGDGEL